MTSSQNGTTPTGTAFDLRKYSIHDGPGIRTTVFFKGCTLQCQWCHNPESQRSEPELVFRDTRCIGCGACAEQCPSEAIQMENGFAVTDLKRCRLCGACLRACPTGAREIAGENMTADEVLRAIERDVPFYDESGGGVTFSGGEPLRQPGFLLEVLRGCRQREIHTAVDTSGYAAWEVIERVRPLVDLFLYDLKLMDSARHRAFTGVPNELILANLEKLARLGHAIHIRIPLIPGVTDSEGNITAAARFVAALPAVRSVALLPYHEAAAQKYRRLGRSYAMDGACAQDEATLQRLANLVESFGLQVKIGG